MKFSPCWQHYIAFCNKDFKHSVEYYLRSQAWAVYSVLHINLLNCKFFGITGEAQAFQILDQSKWSIAWLYSAFWLVESLESWCSSDPKKLTVYHINLQNSVNGLGFRKKKKKKLIMFEQKLGFPAIVRAQLSFPITIAAFPHCKLSVMSLISRRCTSLVFLSLFFDPLANKIFSNLFFLSMDFRDLVPSYLQWGHCLFVKSHLHLPIFTLWRDILSWKFKSFRLDLGGKTLSNRGFDK